jgi:hypothetical protein
MVLKVTGCGLPNFGVQEGNLDFEDSLEQV